MKCKKCLQERNDNDFREYAYKGKVYKRKTCFYCKLSDQNKRRNDLRVFINQYKTKCSRCGFDDYRALQFHHLGDKEINLADAVRKGWSVSRLQKEIEKCEIICANCHSIEHYREVA